VITPFFAHRTRSRTHTGDAHGKETDAGLENLSRALRVGSIWDPKVT